ncbi:hypothetical protein CBR_g66015, partial [Chara braunii]
MVCDKDRFAQWGSHIGKDAGKMAAILELPMPSLKLVSDGGHLIAGLMKETTESFAVEVGRVNTMDSFFRVQEGRSGGGDDGEKKGDSKALVSNDTHLKVVMGGGEGFAHGGEEKEGQQHTLPSPSPGDGHGTSSALLKGEAFVNGGEKGSHNLPSLPADVHPVHGTSVLVKGEADWLAAKDAKQTETDDGKAVVHSPAVEEDVMMTIGKLTLRDGGDDGAPVEIAKLPELREVGLGENPCQNPMASNMQTVEEGEGGSETATARTEGGGGGDREEDPTSRVIADEACCGEVAEGKFCSAEATKSALDAEMADVRESFHGAGIKGSDEYDGTVDSAMIPTKPSSEALEFSQSPPSALPSSSDCQQDSDSSAPTPTSANLAVPLGGHADSLGNQGTAEEEVRRSIPGGSCLGGHADSLGNQGTAEEEVPNSILGGSCLGAEADKDIGPRPSPTCQGSDEQLEEANVCRDPPPTPPLVQRQSSTPVTPPPLLLTIPHPSISGGRGGIPIPKPSEGTTPPPLSIKDGQEWKDLRLSARREREVTTPWEDRLASPRCRTPRPQSGSVVRSGSIGTPRRGTSFSETCDLLALAAARCGECKSSQEEKIVCKHPLPKESGVEKDSDSPRFQAILRATNGECSTSEPPKEVVMEDCAPVSKAGAEAGEGPMHGNWKSARESE